MSRTTIQINVSGYVSEVFCGQITIPAKESFVRYILENRNEAEIPAWLKRRNPSYVNPEYIKQIWYFENDLMNDIMKGAGFVWNTYRQINDVSHRLGFGSGKGDIGLFEISVLLDKEPLIEFVPFEPAIETKQKFGKIKDIKVARIDPEPLPRSEQGHIAISAGSWAKGTMVFRADIDKGFNEDGLELLVADLTNLGIGEDHFVAGLRYAGKDLVGEIVRETDKEMYQISWYSPQKGKWLDMYESG
jgi:hypothetical protein